MCIYILQSVPKSFICCCSGRDSCMLTSRCMLSWLRSAPYTPLYVPVSPCTRSATCKPCPMALVPDSTVHCSRPPARNLDLSWSDHALGPWVGFIYTYKHIYLHTGALSGHHSVPFALSALEPFFGDFSAAGPRLVARLAPSDSPQPRGPCPRAGPPPPRPSRSASEVARSR